MNTVAFFYQSHYRIPIGLERFYSSVNCNDIVHIMYYIYIVYKENLSRWLEIWDLVHTRTYHGTIFMVKGDKVKPQITEIGAHTGASRYSLRLKVRRHKNAQHQK